MIKNEMMGSLAIKKKKDLDAQSISGLTALIFAADSIRQAEIVGESMATASVEFLVDQCRIVADMYLDDNSKNGNGDCTQNLRAKEMKNDDANMPREHEQSVSTKPTVRTAHDLSFLISDKSGESTPVVVKDVDSKTLHDMLDIADEIVISRVDAK